MKKRMLAALLAALMMLACAGAMADDEGAVVRSSCNIVQSGDYYLVYCFAQVHNNSDGVICLDRGTFDLNNGDQVLSTSDVGQLWPYFLSPGEDGYLFDIVAFEPGENGPVMPNVTGIVYDIDYMTMDIAHGSNRLASEARIDTDPVSGAMSVVCEVKNDTEQEAYDPTVAFGLYTAGGDLIYADGRTLQSVGIPAGQTMLVRFYVDNEFVKQWSSYNAMPASAVVNASFRADED